MAIEFNFSQLREGTQGSDYAAGSRTASTQYREQWKCEVTDKGVPITDATAFKMADLLADDALPLVGTTCWNDGDRVDPFALCSNKKGRRHATNPALVYVDIDYGGIQFTGVNELYYGPQAIAANVSAYNAIWELTWDEHLEVLYQDKDTPNKRCALPTGTLYSMPFQDRMPERRYRVTQIETYGLSESDLQNRLFHVNSALYNGLDEGHWLIEEAWAQQIRIEITTGPTDAYITQYLVKRKQIRPWYDRRALIDHYYLREADKIETREEFQSKTGGSYIEGLINKNGTKLSNQDGMPEYETYKDYDSTDFNSFLKLPSNPLP